MKISFHNHGGYYNDGNSHYWNTDSVLDTNTNILSVERTDEYGGQLAGDSQFAHKTDKTKEEVNITPMTPEQQEEIYNVLLSLIETAQKHPHREYFNYFSDRHMYLITGRFGKAFKLCHEWNTGYYGTDCACSVFILPAKKMVVRVYIPKRTETQQWKCTIENMERKSK